MVLEILYKDAAWLREKYSTGLSWKSISGECGVTKRTVMVWARKFGIPSRVDNRPKPYLDSKWLEQQYVLGKSTEDIAKGCGRDPSTIAHWARVFNIEYLYLSRGFVNGTKVCLSCKRDLDVSQYHKDKKSKIGYVSNCKNCTSIRDKIRRDSLSPYKKLKYKLIADQWKAKNSDKVHAAQRSFKKRYRSTVNGKLQTNISRSIHLALRNENLSKGGRHWEDLVGYTVYDLREHLENQFETWMSWSNWGTLGAHTPENPTWQIDHIKPISSFRVTSLTCDSFKECWALDNLRPLDAMENIKKGKKYNLSSKFLTSQNVTRRFLMKKLAIVFLVSIFFSGCAILDLTKTEEGRQLLLESPEIQEIIAQPLHARKEEWCALDPIIRMTVRLEARLQNLIIPVISDPQVCVVPKG